MSCVHLSVIETTLFISNWHYFSGVNGCKIGQNNNYVFYNGIGVPLNFSTRYWSSIPKAIVTILHTLYKVLLDTICSI